MSTSPRRSPRIVAPLDPPPLPDLQPFPYATLPASAASREAATDPFRTDGLRSGANDSGAAETAEKGALARLQARQEGEAQASKTFDERLVIVRASVADALAKFTRDRAAYFGQVE